MAEGDRNPRQDWDEARQRQDGEGPEGKGDGREREREQRDKTHAGDPEGRDYGPSGRGRPSDAPWLGGG